INQTADELRLLTSSYRIKPEPVDAAELIKNVTTAFLALNHDFTIDIDTENKQHTVLADPKKLFQVFASLLNTAGTISTDQSISLILTAKPKKCYLIIPITTKWSDLELT